MQYVPTKKNHSRLIILLLFSSILLFHFGVFTEYTTSSNGASTLTGIDFLYNHSNNVRLLEIPNIWIIVSLSAALGGMCMYLYSKQERGYGFLFGLAGFTGLILLQSSASNSITSPTNNVVILHFTWGYWVSVIHFALAACISFIQQSNNQRFQQESPRQLHINIISSSEISGYPPNEASSGSTDKKSPFNNQ
jgi:hypothetical protein